MPKWPDPTRGRDITGVQLKKEQKIKRSRFSEEQIIGILQEAEAGSPIKAVCAAHNISVATYHAWKRKFGGMEVSEAKSKWREGRLLVPLQCPVPSPFRTSARRPLIRRMTQGGRNGLFSAPKVSLLFPTPTFARFAPVGRPGIPDFRYRWMMRFLSWR
jgi:Transposase